MQNILISAMLVDVEGYTFPSANPNEPVLCFYCNAAIGDPALFTVNSIMVNSEMSVKAEVCSQLWCKKINQSLFK